MGVEPLRVETFRKIRERLPRELPEAEALYASVGRLVRLYLEGKITPGPPEAVEALESVRWVWEKIQRKLENLSEREKRILKRPRLPPWTYYLDDPYVARRMGVSSVHGVRWNVYRSRRLKHLILRRVIRTRSGKIRRFRWAVTTEAFLAEFLASNMNQGYLRPKQRGWRGKPQG